MTSSSPQNVAIFLDKAYQDLLATCGEIHAHGWPEQSQIEELSIYIADIRYWSREMQKVVEIKPSANRETLQ